MNYNPIATVAKYTAEFLTVTNYELSNCIVQIYSLLMLSYVAFLHYLYMLRILRILEPHSLITGGRSFGCSKNSGAAGTFYDAVPRRLIIDNYNLSTDTNTLLLEFPNQPLWTNVFIQNQAKATVPLLWSRVQVNMI